MLKTRWNRAIGICVGVVLFAFASASNRDHYMKNRSAQIMRTGSTEELKTYIETNPGSLELKSNLDMTPLLNAAYQGNEEGVKLLLKMGADIRATGLGQQFNALHCAAVNGNVNVANFLIEGNVEVNARSNKNETPLDVAQRNRHVQFVAFLRANGGKGFSELSVAPAPK
ncbi:MAG: ankyrin repeat domain-containing protein [Planctomycetota bacterium]